MPPAEDETAVPPPGDAVPPPGDPLTAAAGPTTAEETSAVADPEEAPVVARPPRPGARRPVPTPGATGNGGYGPGGAKPAGNGGGTDEREAERGLRGLVGSGSSQVSVGAALRARDAARPSEEQLADADRNLTIVRRNWVPREDLPRNR